MNKTPIKDIVEAVMLAAGKPLTIDNLLAVFSEDEKPEREELRQTIESLQKDYEDRGIELVRVASGFRIQVRQSMESWVSRLIQEKPARYSRALLETLSLVAYRQPITRGEIEDIRGVSVSTSIMKTLQEREWVRIVGHRDVPGKPAMYGTTRQFLDYFNVKSLDELPTLMELRDLDSISPELELLMQNEAKTADSSADMSEETSEETSVDDASMDDATVVSIDVDAEDPPDVLH